MGSSPRILSCSTGTRSIIYDTFFAENDRLIFDFSQPGVWEFRVDGLAPPRSKLTTSATPSPPCASLSQTSSLLPTASGLDFEASVSEAATLPGYRLQPAPRPLSISLDTHQAGNIFSGRTTSSSATPSFSQPGAASGQLPHQPGLRRPGD